MTRPDRQHGIALLLVLVALVLSVTAVAGLARVTATARMHHERDATTSLTRDLLHAAGAPILDWLERHAGRVVLPPEVSSPRFLVLDDRFQVRGKPCRITITAFDQCGMVPFNQTEGRLAAALPSAAARLRAQAGRGWDEHPGLDLLGAAGHAHPVFPEPGAPDRTALGERLATHNPVRPGRPATLNINTAPFELVAAVYAMHDLGGTDAVSDARAQGRVASPGAARAPRTGGAGPRILPVSMSTAWAFRIDCRAGQSLESWWCVYIDTGSSWERAQRLAITE
ncbi:MAG: hypothetical protein ACF8LK_03805 [Phycisphaerales bacterium JB041]